MPKQPLPLLQGTLDALILKTLSRGPRHGYAIARWLEEATDDALQIGHRSLERFEEPRAAQRNIRPRAVALRNLQRVRLAVRVVEIDAHLGDGGPERPFDFKLRHGVARTVGVRVIQRQAAADQIAVVKDDAGADAASRPGRRSSAELTTVSGRIVLIPS